MSSSRTASSNLTSLVEKEHRSRNGNDQDGHISLEIYQRSAIQSRVACPICLDTLVDEDDIRVLTCDHGFHAACLDPWLTRRCACCPICKRDYYVSELSQQDEASLEQVSGSHCVISQTPSQIAPPQQPEPAWQSERSVLSRNPARPQ